MDHDSSTEQLISAETSIGYLLRAGVILGGGLILAGCLFSALRPNSDIFLILKTGQEIPSGLVNRFEWSNLIEGVISGSSHAWTTLGLIVLIGLPTARVALVALVFLIQRDYLFVLFSILVLFNLVFGFLSHSLG